MKRALFAVAALALVATSTGCCCFERMFCGCGSNCYGHEGPCQGGCGAGCGGSGCSDCGMAGGSVTEQGYADADGGYINEQVGPGSYVQRPAGKRHPAGGHPMVHQRRNAGGQYEFAAGPPTAGVTYPYYTNRGPRDFLAKNPRSIGP